jgi:hypothetical protein
VKFSLRALLVFVLFALVFTLANDPRLGFIAVAAWLIVEALLWSGVAGFGRGGRA